MNKKDTAKQARIKKAHGYIQEYRGCKIAANITHVSSSGMSRRIKFYAIKDSNCINITHLIADVTGYTLTKDYELRVSGCGMDMVFSVLSNFNYAMAQLDTGKTLRELLDSKECGENIYPDYFIDANNYQLL